VTKSRTAALWLVLAALAAPLAAPAPAADEAKGPRIAAEPTAFDFGKALQGKTLHKDFVIKNFGTEDLEIEKVSTTCGCTAAFMDNDTKVVKPGRTAVLRVSLETRTSAGKVERKVLVQSNDPVRNPLELRVQATVVAGE
jgi:hypothetical protein